MFLNSDINLLTTIVPERHNLFKVQNEIHLYYLFGFNCYFGSFYENLTGYSSFGEPKVGKFIKCKYY